jgi:hypothetical protein
LKLRSRGGIMIFYSTSIQIMSKHVLGCKYGGVVRAQLIFVRKKNDIKPDVVLQTESLKAVKICEG